MRKLFIVKEKLPDGREFSIWQSSSANDCGEYLKTLESNNQFRSDKAEYKIVWEDTDDEDLVGEY